MAWNPIRHPVDYVKLNDQKSPGVASFQGAGSPRKWEEKEGYGYAGAILIYRGRGLASFSLYVDLDDTDEDWAAWDVWKILVKRPPPMTRPKAISIWHPLLLDLDIKAVVVEDVKMAVRIDESGTWRHEINLKEYRPLKIALAKPDGAAATEVDPIDAKIDEMAAQVDKLSRPR